jgi:hypothetical protein
VSLFIGLCVSLFIGLCVSLFIGLCVSLLIGLCVNLWFTDFRSGVFTRMMSSGSCMAAAAT